MLLGMFSGLPYTIVAVVNFDGAVAKRCVEKLGLLCSIFGWLLQVRLLPIKLDFDSTAFR